MNLYETVTNKLIEAMEAGNVPWRKPWRAGIAGDGCSIPQNHLTNRVYRGINVWLLACAPYGSQRWMTYKQAQQMGGHVRKGETGWPVVFWKFDRERDKTTGEEKRFAFMRQYTVFNVAQIDELPIALPFDAPDFNPIEAAERIKDGYFNRDGAPSLNHSGGDRACYSPSSDSVTMPKPEQFIKPEGYYQTLFHEAGHSTGHVSRLDRKDGMSNFFGDHLYSKEELVAEFTAAFLCAECGISNEYTEQNSAAYLQSWIRVFKNDSAIAVSAAQRAQKAADHILNRQAAAAESDETQAA